MDKPWHLLVYIAADNSLYSDALVSLRQITDASLLSSVRITVQFDGPTSDNSVRYKCEGGKRTVIWTPPAGYPLDRGARLQGFLDDQTPTPITERIFLILWGHGAGLDHVYLYNDQAGSTSASANPAPAHNGAKEKPAHDAASADAASADAPSADAAAPPAGAKLQVPRGFPFDLLNPDNANANRYLKDIQLGKILADYKQDKLKVPIDILGFDACLMGLAEICYELAPSVQLIIASDEELPKGSWPYDTILEDLTRFPGMDSNSLSAVIVSRFMERYLKESKRTRISLSAYLLERSKELAEAIGLFVREVLGNIDDRELRNRVLLARDFSRTPEVPDYIDLGVFCHEIIQSFADTDTIRLLAVKILNILVKSPYILYHRDAGENGPVVPTGLAIYFPERIPPAQDQVDQAVHDRQGVQSYSPMAPLGPAPAVQFNSFNPQKGNQLAAGSGVKTPTADHTKSLLLVGKTPTADHTKTPTADHTKTPPGGRVKGADGVRVVERQLIGSEILWNDYQALSFNKETGWAAMIHDLITYNSKPAYAAPAAGTGQPVG